MLSEHIPGATAEESVRSGTPLLVINSLQQTSVPYPTSSADLKSGHTYAWIVEYMVNGVPVIATEAWIFTIRDQQPIPEIKYIKLRQSDNSNTYLAVNDRVYFSFEDATSSGNIHISLRDRKGAILEPVSMPDGTSQQTLTAQGFNHFVLDLTPYNLGEGYYLLTITNSKGDKYTLYAQIE